MYVNVVIRFFLCYQKEFIKNLETYLKISSILLFEYLSFHGLVLKFDLIFANMTKAEKFPSNKIFHQNKIKQFEK